MNRYWLGQAKTIRRLGFGLAVGITICMLLLRLMPDLFYRLEATALDARFKARGERSPGDEIVLVVIDEKSLKEVGRWPWPRAIQARLTEAISAARPRVIGLDIIYSEPDPADRQLGKSFRDTGNVVLAFPFFVAEKSSALPPDVAGPAAAIPEFVRKSQFMVIRQAGSDVALTPYRAFDIQFPPSALTAQAAAAGHVYYIPDRDGITRYEYLAVQYGEAGEIYPSFALEMARVYLNIPKEQVSLVLGEAVSLGSEVIPTDQKGRMLIDYVGPELSFKYVSATDVLHHRVPGEIFRDKAVFVGTAAFGAYDQKASPFSANVSGTEKNATVVENIIHGRVLKRPLWAGLLDVGMIVLCGLGLGLLLPHLGGLWGTIATSATVIGYALFTQYAFVAQNLWIDVVYPTLTILLTFVAITVLREFVEEKQAKEIRAMFSSYVSPQVVEELIRDPRKATVSGEWKELTMLFCDLVGFTSFGERHSAEEVVAQLNEYLSAMTDVVFYWQGTLDKFIGDGLVAFWGAPLGQPDHVELGVKCALHMRRRFTELQNKWRAEGKHSFDCGIGLNTGMAIVGNIGAEGKKLDYTMIGDEVNLASRVQQLTRAHGCSLIVTRSTAEGLKRLADAPEGPGNRGHVGHIALRWLESAVVKGKARPVDVYALESLDRERPSRLEELGVGALIEVR